MEKDILLLVGLSGCGKDYLSKKLVEEYGFNNNVSYTTRPMRNGETNGIEYHFINSNEEFNQLVESGEIFEKTEYHTKHGLWLYGYGKKSFPLKDEQLNVSILNPDGVRQFLESEMRDRIAVLDIHAPTHLRLEKICERYGGIHKMTDSQITEAFRREVEDATPFHEYFNADSDDVNWINLFRYIPDDKWNHKYDGELNIAIKRIENIMDIKLEVNR